MISYGKVRREECFGKTQQEAGDVVRQNSETACWVRKDGIGGA